MASCVYAEALSETGALDRNTRHDKIKGSPWHFKPILVRLIFWHLKGTSFQSFMIENETIAIPSEKLDGLMILTEEYKYVAGYRTPVQFVLDDRIQAIDAIAHADCTMAKVVVHLFT